MHLGESGGHGAGMVIATRGPWIDMARGLVIATRGPSGTCFPAGCIAQRAMRLRIPSVACIA